MSTQTFLATTLAGVLSTMLSITLATAQEPNPYVNAPANERTETDEPYQGPGGMSHGIGGMSHGVGGMSHPEVGSSFGEGSMGRATDSNSIPFGGGNGNVGGMIGPGYVWVIPRASSAVSSPASSGGTSETRLREERGHHHDRDG